MRRILSGLAANGPMHIGLILALALAVYSNTFYVPFHFDDKFYIVNNPAVRDPWYFFGHARTGNPELDAMAHLYKVRLVGSLTFALNYRLHGLDVRGYHIFNFTVHAINGILLYMLTLGIFGLRRLRDSAVRPWARYIALFAALVFVTHPLQTQGVTYITQRFASLAALFYLAAMLSYLAYRRAMEDGLGPVRTYLPYALCLALTALGMKTKEHAFTIPVALALMEITFFAGPVWRRLARLVPALLLMLVIPLSVMDFETSLGEAMRRATVTQDEITPAEYLITQFRVLPTYMRLIFIPTGQRLDYDYPLYRSLSEPEVAASVALLVALGGLLGNLYYITRQDGGGANARDQALRVAAMGGAWFFLALSVESSFIALEDLIFEHRLYLPNAGVCLMAGTLGAYAMKVRPGLLRPGVALACLIVASLSVAAYIRNDVWRSEISLWQDEVRKSPLKARTHTNLGAALMARGRDREALGEFERAVGLDPQSAEAWNDLGAAQAGLGLIVEAVESFEQAVAVKGTSIEARVNLCQAYAAMGRFGEAARECEAALALDPQGAAANERLSEIHRRMGLLR